MRLVLSSAFLLACRSDVQKVVSEPTDDAQVITDLDGDGYDQEEDCDDSDATVNPSAEELCDGLDNNCDGQIDEGVLTEYYLDNDADGYGDPGTITESCEPPEGYVPFGSDCDDNNNTVHPSASEICDELDNDCNDEVDEGVGELVFVDRDEDGFGDDQTQQLRCDVVPGFSAVGGDCDDLNDSINPDSAEICDSLDNDCNGSIDEGVTNIYYADSDADGYGDPDSVVEACERPSGAVENNLDCEDLDTAISPAETESCDGVDNNCDGQIDETGALGSVLYFIDSDGDGYGDSSNSQLACGQPLG